ncbi:hypothetical protein [Geomicrobium halophilum]|uniref:hypothetical protein n=1 Tax=Geomicrobium halophilum TaxID=549000 RepID=UPI003CCDD433
MQGIFEFQTMICEWMQSIPPCTTALPLEEEATSLAVQPTIRTTRNLKTPG